MNADADHGGIPDLNGMSTAQRAVVALDLLPGFIEEAQQAKKKRGPGRPESKLGKAAARAAKLVGVGRTSVEVTVAIQKRDESVIEQMRSGELNVAQAARAVGLTGRGGRWADGYVLSTSERDAAGRSQPKIFYGKGDKWKEAVGPLIRYLGAWERKNYEFRHVAPREARRRLTLIAELQEKLNAAKADLEQRAHSATLTIKKG